MGAVAEIVVDLISLGTRAKSMLQNFKPFKIKQIFIELVQYFLRILNKNIKYSYWKYNKMFKC